METKIKVTYLDQFNNGISARIFKILGWGDLQNQLINQNIQEAAILKIEIVIEAEDYNTVES